MMDQPSRPEAFAGRIEGLLEHLRKDAEKRGWAFFKEPSPNLLPAFLGGHRPDAISIGPDGGAIIEIKTHRSDGQKESLAKIASLVRAQKGWEFRFFYVAPPAEAALSLGTPTQGELASGIAEARALLETGHERAALVIAWALLEALARLVTVREDSTETRPLTPVQAVQTLAEQGYLDEVDARRLRALTKLRNVVVHGDLGAIVPIEDVSRLVFDVEHIIFTVNEASSDSEVARHPML